MAEASVAARVHDLIEPPLSDEGFEVVDVAFGHGELRVTIDREGGVDLDAITRASHSVSRLLDDHDVVPGRYALQVSSPGVERPLRAPAHFRRFVGQPVVGRTVPGTGGERRFEGVLESADDEGVVVAGRRLAYADIERARTKFVWPGSAGRRAAS